MYRSRFLALVGVCSVFIFTVLVSIMLGMLIFMTGVAYLFAPSKPIWNLPEWALLPVPFIWMASVVAIFVQMAGFMDFVYLDGIMLTISKQILCWVARLIWKSLKLVAYVVAYLVATIFTVFGFVGYLKATVSGKGIVEWLFVFALGATIFTSFMISTLWEHRRDDRSAARLFESFGVRTDGQYQIFLTAVNIAAVLVVVSIAVHFLLGVMTGVIYLIFALIYRHDEMQHVRIKWGKD